MARPRIANGRAIDHASVARLGLSGSRGEERPCHREHSGHANALVVVGSPERRERKQQHGVDNGRTHDQAFACDARRHALRIDR